MSVALPWPVLLDEFSRQIQSATRSNTHTRQPSAHDDDEFRSRLWLDGFVCDALDTMNQWYYCIILKTDRSQNSVKIHYDGWPSKYDEWIDVASHRLQPFMSRAKLSQRPFITRGNPGHAPHSINLDRLLPPEQAAESPSPPASQYQPSSANNLDGVNGANAHDIGQLSFDLSSCIAMMGDRSSRSGASSTINATTFSKEVHSFSLKLQKAIGSSNSNSTPDVNAYAFTESMLNLISSHLSSKDASSESGFKSVELPTQLSIQHPTAGSLYGRGAIQALASANILPPPSMFIAQSLSPVSALDEMSFKNSSFIQLVSEAYQLQYQRNYAKNIAENFISGLYTDLLAQLPFGASGPNLANDFPDSLRPVIPPTASIPICSYLLTTLQHHLSKYTLQPIPPLRLVDSVQPRGSVHEMQFLIPLNLKEVHYYSDVQAFLQRILRLSDDGHEDVIRLKEVALGTFVSFMYALGRQDCILSAILQVMEYFETECDKPNASKCTAQPAGPHRLLLNSLSSMTQSWSRGSVMASNRLFGLHREELNTGLSEARSPLLTSGTVSTSAAAPAATLPIAASNSTPHAGTASSSSTSSLPSAATKMTDVRPLLSDDYPSPSSLVNLTSFQLTEATRMVLDPTGSWIWCLTHDFGLIKMGTGENGTIGGMIVKQNSAFAFHAAYGHLAFLPSPVNSCGVGYSGSGTLLLRTQLCHREILCIDPNTLQFLDASITVPLDDSSVTIDSSPSWQLRYPFSIYMGQTGYDPANLPPLVLPPTWQTDVMVVGVICDAMDSEGDWYPGMVIATTTNPEPAVTIQFDGWGNDHNQIIPLASKRLAPFGSRINTLQRFSKSTQQGDHLLDLTVAIRTASRSLGRTIFQPPNLNSETFQKEFREGFILDVRDTSDMWYAAEIVKMTDDTVTVRFDGWPPFYNETIPKTSKNLAPFCSQTSLTNRLKDPQQNSKFALNLDLAIAEVRGRNSKSLDEDESLTPQFFQRFEKEILRSSDWSFGKQLFLYEGRTDVFILFDATGMTLVNHERGTRKKCEFGLLTQWGDVAVETNGIHPSQTGIGLLSASEAIRVRSILDAGLPFFVLDHSSTSEHVDLFVLRFREDGAHYRVSTFALPKHLQPHTTTPLGPIIKEVHLQDTIPLNQVSQPTPSPDAKKDKEKADRDLDLVCRSCGTFLTAPTALKGATSSNSPFSLPQLVSTPASRESPGVRAYLKCTAHSCDKAKMLLCLPCQTFCSLPVPHEASHQVVMIENPIDESQSTTTTPPVPFRQGLTTKICQVMALFDPRDETIILATIPLTITGDNSTPRAAYRPLDFRVFSLADGRLTAAPTPTTAAVTFFLHSPVYDYSIYPAGTHPNAGSLLAWRLNKNGTFGRSTWMSKTPGNNPRHNSHAFLRHLSSDEDRTASTFTLLATMLRQMINSIPVVETQEHLLPHFFQAIDVVLRVGRLYSKHNDSSLAQQVFIDALRLLISYLSSLTALWPLIRLENPTTSLETATNLQEQKNKLKAFLINELLPSFLSESQSTSSDDSIRTIQGLISHIISIGFGFFFETWSERFLFIRKLINALPSNSTPTSASSSSADASLLISKEESSFPFRFLRHLLLSYFQQNWLGNPAGHSTSKVGQNVFVDLEMTTKDLGVIGVQEEDGFVKKDEKKMDEFDRLDSSTKPSSTPPPPTASIFSHEFQEQLSFFLEFVFTPAPTDLEHHLGHPSVPRVLVNYLLIAFQFHLNRMIPQTNQTSARASLTLPQPNRDGLIRVPIADVQYCQAKRCTDLLLQIVGVVFRQFATTVQADSSPTKSNDESGLEEFLTARKTLWESQTAFRQLVSESVPAAAASTSGQTQIVEELNFVDEYLGQLQPNLDELQHELFPSSPTHSSKQQQRSTSTHAIQIHSAFHELFKFTSFILARIDLKFASADRILELLPQVFWSVYELDCKFLPKSLSYATHTHKPLFNTDRLTFTLPPTHRLLFHSLPPSHSLKSNLLQIQQLSSLFKASFVSLCKMIYSVDGLQDLSIPTPKNNTNKDHKGDTATDSSLKLAQLTELSHFASTPLAPHHQVFLEKFVNCQLLDETASPELFLSQLIHQCLFEMGGGTSSMDLGFAWSMERAAAATLMRFMFVSNETHSESTNALVSPKKDANSASTSQTLLLDCCYHFAYSLDIHVLLSKLKSKNIRLLIQPELPFWFKQLIYTLFEHIRVPLLERMREQTETNQTDNDRKEVKGETKEQEAKSDVGDEESKQPQPADLSTSPSPESTPSPDGSNKLRANTHTRLHVMRLLNNAKFLLFHDFRGTITNSKTTDFGSPNSRALTSPKFIPNRSPQLSPLESLSLGESAALTYPSMESLSLRTRSNSITLGSSGGMDQYDDGDDGDDEQPVSLALIRSLSDRMPSMSPNSVTSATDSVASVSSSTQHSLAVKRMRRSNILGSASWITGLLSTVMPQDQAFIEAFMQRTQNHYRLTQARVELLKLINSQLSADRPRTRHGVLTTNIIFDEYLPIIYSTLSSGAVSGSSNHRLHLLYPSVSICEMHEKAARRQLRDGSTHGSMDDQTTLLTFMKMLTGRLNASISSFDKESSVLILEKESEQLTLIFKFLSQEFHITPRDQAILVQSGILDSLMTFTFHPANRTKELTRVSWTVLEYLITNILSSSGQSSMLGGVNSLIEPVASLQLTLQPLYNNILANLTFISTSISNFNSLLYLPPTEMISQTSRYVPPPLDLDRLAVDQLIDAKDKANSWYPSKIVKLEKKVGGMEAFVQFSDWSEKNNEWIPIKSGRLATLFTHVDVEAYSVTGRPNKYRLDLVSAIADYKSRTGSRPLTEETKSAAKAHAQWIQSQINERIMLTINMIRVVSSTSMNPSAGSGPLVLISSLLRHLTSNRPLPILIQIELIHCLKKLLPKYTVNDFTSPSTAPSSNLANDQDVLSAPQVVHYIMKILGSAIWSARTSPAQHVRFDSESSSPLESETWLYQNWFDPVQQVTDGARKVQKLIAVFLFDTFLNPDAANKQSNGWTYLFISTITTSLNDLSTITSLMKSIEQSSSPQALFMAGGDDRLLLALASMKLLGGFESYLLSGSRVSVKWNEESENTNVDSHEMTIEHMRPQPVEPASLTSTATNTFDFSTILHGYVYSVSGSHGLTPSVSVEVLRELDSDHPEANETNLSKLGNTAYTESFPRTEADSSKYTLMPTTLTNIQLLPVRKLQLRSFVDEKTSQQLKETILTIIRSCGLTAGGLELATNHSNRILLQQLQWESLRILSAQVDDGSWSCDSTGLITLLQLVINNGSAPSDYFTFNSIGRAVPQTDIFMQALSLINSSAYQLEQDHLLGNKSNCFRLPSALSSISDVSTVNSPQATVDDLDDGVELPLPDILALIENITSMGYTEAQARAAIFKTGSLDLNASVELILNNHPSINRVITDEQWNTFLEAQGVKRTVEKYLKQQARKKATPAASSVITPAAMRVLSNIDWNCPLCTAINPGANLMCDFCSTMRPPSATATSAPVPTESEVAASAASSTSSTTDSSSAPANLQVRRPLDYQSSDLFLSTNWSNESLKKNQHHSLTRTPMTKVASLVPSIIGLSVTLKTPLTASPQLVLQSGIIVKVIPVVQQPNVDQPATSSSSNGEQASTASSIRGLVLVYFIGSAHSSHQPIPSTYAWLPLADLYLDPISPLNVSRLVMVMAMTQTRAQLEADTVLCFQQSSVQLAKNMLNELARKHMTSTMTISSAITPAFTLQQLLSYLPVLAHPIDSVPNLMKRHSKNRLRVIEDVTAYLLRSSHANKNTLVDPVQFDQFIRQAQDIVNQTHLAIRNEAQIPTDPATQPISIVPITSGSSTSTPPSSSTPGLVSILFHSLSSLEEGNILSFYSDPLHLHLLKQITFQLNTVKDKSIDLPPLVLPTPLYITYTDADFRNLLSSPQAKGADLEVEEPTYLPCALSKIIHITPWTVDELKSVSALIDITTYLLSQASTLNGIHLTRPQQTILHSSILFPLFTRLLSFVTLQLLPRGYVPSNIFFVCTKLLTQILTIWSGTPVDQLPQELLQSFEGPCVIGACALLTSLNTLLALKRRPSPLQHQAIVHFLTTYESPIWNQLLALDHILYSQLIDRYAHNDIGSLGQPGTQSTYLTMVMEGMTAIRLLLMEHAPARTDQPDKFDLFMRGSHLTEVMTDLEHEFLAASRVSLLKAQNVLNSWSGPKEGMDYDHAQSTYEEAKSMMERHVSLEMRLVRNMTLMIRRAQGKKFKRRQPSTTKSIDSSPTIPPIGQKPPLIDVSNRLLEAATSSMTVPASIQQSNPSTSGPFNQMDGNSASLVQSPSYMWEEDDTAAPIAPLTSSTTPAASPNAGTTEQQCVAFDSRTLLHFDLSTSSIFGTILFPKMAGNRWMGLQQVEANDHGLATEVEERKTDASSSSSIPPSPSVRLERLDSNKSESGESISTFRPPFCSSLLPSQTVRLQLFHDLVQFTRTKERTVPDFTFDTSTRWDENLAAEENKEKLKNSKVTPTKKSSSNKKVTEKMTLFDQLCGQLSSTPAALLRGPIGEYSFKASFVGLTDEGAQGWVGMFKQCLATMTHQLIQTAFRPDSLSESLLIPCPNGLEEVGSNRNKLILNPNLVQVKDLKKFFNFGILLGCSIRSSTCLPLDMSKIFFQLLLFGVDSILGGPSEQAFENGMTELRRIDVNAANMLRFIINMETDGEGFTSLGLTYSTSLSGGIVQIDLFPGGSLVPVLFKDRMKYARLVLYHRLNESCCAFQAIRAGLRSILPSTAPNLTSTHLLGGDQLNEYLPSPSGGFHLLTSDELELLICGRRELDLSLLKTSTTYKNATENSPIIQFFWQVLEEFSQEDRGRFLQFAFGRSRLPANWTESKQHMTLNVVELPGWWKVKYPAPSSSASVAASSPPGSVPTTSSPLPDSSAAITLEDASGLRLPKSQTCFFIVDLPNYPTIDILRHKLTMALGCTDINF